MTLLLFASLPLLVVALLLRALFLGYPRASFQGVVLSAREQAVVAAAADALFPSGGPIPLSGTEAGVVPYLDANLARLPAKSRTLVRLLFILVEQGPWFFGPARRRFTRLSPKERGAELRRMQQSRLYLRRIAFLSLRTMLAMGYLANPRVAERIGIGASAHPCERLSGATS